MKILQRVFDDVTRHCLVAAPDEAVGVLAGSPHDRPPGIVVKGMRLTNVSDFPRDRFELDEVQQVLAWQRLADEGRRVLVIYHSHVRHGVELSDTDIRYAAADPSILHLVVSLRDHGAALWRVTRENVVEPVSFEVVT